LRSEPVGAVANYISPEAADALRREIEQIDGAEVFAVGRCDPNYVVCDLSVLARGNRGAAPVVDGVTGVTASEEPGRVKAPAAGNGAGRNLKVDAAASVVHVLL